MTRAKFILSCETGCPDKSANSYTQRKGMTCDEFASNLIGNEKLPFKTRLGTLHVNFFGK